MLQRAHALPGDTVDTSLTSTNERTVIRPSTGWVSLQLHELWRSRELLYFLVWRDVKVRYKQTLLGASWAVLQPVATMVVFTVIFDRIAGVETGDVRYPLFAFCGLVPWTLFTQGLQMGANSMVANGNLISKVYFPRLLVPLANVLSGLVDLAIALAVLLAMTVVLGDGLDVRLLAVPLFVLLALITCIGFASGLAALNVRFRDVRHVLPLLLQLWLLATPIAYATSSVGQPWVMILGLNPMTGVVEGFRWAVLGSEDALGDVLPASVVVAIAALVIGTAYFRRVERRFADII